VGATKKDVVDVVTSYRSLTYDLQRFGKNQLIAASHLHIRLCKNIAFKFIHILVFNDGSSKELFTIQGTIPVVYKSNKHISNTT